MTRSDSYLSDDADDQTQPVSRGIGASWLAACMAHDMLYGGDIVRAAALLRNAGRADEAED
ncbi:MAG: hypothetical protein QM698_03380 [Micropepsaceae bacterium]